MIGWRTSGPATAPGVRQAGEGGGECEAELVNAAAPFDALRKLLDHATGSLCAKGQDSSQYPGSASRQDRHSRIGGLRECRGLETLQP
jgi:hypothetical protein